MFLIGQILGSLLSMLVLYIAWKFIIFRWVVNSTARGNLLSAVAAYLSAATISGFGEADGGPFVWSAFLFSFPAALVVGIFAYRNGIRLRDQSEGVAPFE